MSKLAARLSAFFYPSNTKEDYASDRPILPRSHSVGTPHPAQPQQTYGGGFQPNYQVYTPGSGRGNYHDGGGVYESEYYERGDEDAEEYGEEDIDDPEKVTTFYSNEGWSRDYAAPEGVTREEEEEMEEEEFSYADRVARDTETYRGIPSDHSPMGRSRPLSIAAPPPAQFSSISSFHRAPLPSQLDRRPPNLPPKVPDLPPPLPPPLSTLLYHAAYPPLFQTFALIRNHLPVDLTLTLSAPLSPLPPAVMDHLSTYPNPFSILPPPSANFPNLPAPLHNLLQKLSSHPLQKYVESFSTIPRAVLEMWSIHDGQDSFSVVGGGRGEGLVWGLWLMSVEEIETEWGFWRKWDGVGTALIPANDLKGKGKGKAVEGAPFESVPIATPTPAMSAQSSYFPNDFKPPIAAASMSSCPAGWVKETYSHPGWIPLLTDRCGNYIGIDLDPPQPAEGTKGGCPGQVIAFGREIDEKVVMYGCEGTGGWGRFLRGFAEDVERGGAGFAAFGNRLLEVDEEEEGTSGSEDGIGDLGYLENGLEGVQDDSDASDGLYFDDDGYINGKKANGVVSKKKDSAVFGGGNFRGPVKARHPSKWRLRKEWKKWTADHEGEGGVVGALAERSRRLWRDREGLLGRLELQKRERALYTQSRNDENSKGKDKEDNFDTATLSPRSSTARGSISLNGPSGSGPLSMNVNVQPPSPIGAMHADRRSSTSSSNRSSLKRAAPPPPAPIALPTADDLYNRSSGSPIMSPTSYAQPNAYANYQDNDSRTSLTGTRRSTGGWGFMGGAKKKDPSLLPMVSMDVNSLRSSADLGENEIEFAPSPVSAAPLRPNGHVREESWGQSVQVIVPPDSGARSPISPRASASPRMGSPAVSPRAQSPALLHSPVVPHSPVMTGVASPLTLSSDAVNKSGLSSPVSKAEEGKDVLSEVKIE